MLINGKEWAIRTTSGGRVIAESEGILINAPDFNTCLVRINQATAPPPRINLQVTCHSGKTWTTGFNGTFAEAEEHFLGHTVTDEDFETGKETNHIITGVITL